ncbi:hypothetical protein OFN63_30525, partial [Escherichia coli]|nr:hypothetical protein [Escherichia coli]
MRGSGHREPGGFCLPGAVQPYYAVRYCSERAFYVSLAVLFKKVSLRTVIVGPFAFLQSRYNHIRL